MEPLIIVATEDTPNVHFSSDENIYILSERSLPENSIDFYLPILKWLESYATAPNPKTVFEFKLEYFNTSSAKQIAKILLLLEKISANKEVLIKWYYAKDDKDIFASGVRYSKLINVPFEFVEM